MLQNYNTWTFTTKEQDKFNTWLERINSIHTGNLDLRNSEIYLTTPSKPLSESTVGLFTTAGVHLNSDESFDVASPHGDWTFRKIPMDVDISDLEITHTHYNHVEADKDINCIFPVDRLRELLADGLVGGISPHAYSIMGFNPDPTNLVNQTIPELTEQYKSDGVDILFMTCG
jgi:D-proline reductase (dithiol) PrdB